MGRGFSRAFLTILLGVAAFFVLQATLQTFRVEGGSMEPGLYQGENLLVNKIAYMHLNVDTLRRSFPFLGWLPSGEWHPFDSPRRGDLVVLNLPGAPFDIYVKRIVAVPGDTIWVRNGLV